MPSYKLRIWYLRRVIGIKIGESTSIHMGCFFAGSNISLGSNTVLARKCYLDGRNIKGFITIKDNVSISPECCIISMSHQTNSPIFQHYSKNVIIEKFAWLGTRSIIQPGVTIGVGGVVGAGSVVTKSVEDYTIVGGIPAKNIGIRSKELKYTLEYFPLFNGDY